MKLVSLLPEEREELLALARQVHDIKTGVRIRVILALDAGYTIKEVAEILLLDEDTVTKIKKKYDKRQFFSDWLSDAYKGYEGKLTKEQEMEIDKLVEKETITDCRQVVDFIRNEYCKIYTITGVTKLLHRLGFVYKQVVLIPGNSTKKRKRHSLKSIKILRRVKKQTK